MYLSQEVIFRKYANMTTRARERTLCLNSQNLYSYFAQRYIFFRHIDIGPKTDWKNILLAKTKNGQILSWYHNKRKKLLMRQTVSSELHKIPARVQCTVQCADWIDEPAPPTIP
jgi:hypothetical protein